MPIPRDIVCYYCQKGRHARCALPQTCACSECYPTGEEPMSHAPATCRKCSAKPNEFVALCRLHAAAPGLNLELRQALEGLLRLVAPGTEAGLRAHAVLRAAKGAAK
jgi:hypothetical protein